MQSTNYLCVKYTNCTSINQNQLSMHVSLAQIVHRATTDDDEQFSPASLPWCVNGCCRRCGSSSVVVEGGSRLAAEHGRLVPPYQHLHLGMNSLMLMESVIRAGQAVGGVMPCCRRGRARAACYQTH